MQAPCQRRNAIAERRTFALSMARALPITSYKRPLSLPHLVMQESTLSWRSKVLRQGSTTTRFPSSTASTRMTLAYPNTSGTLRTATPISQSSGRLSAVQDLTGETCYLCLMEKLCILYADKSTLRNKRSELITKCRHENKCYAANQKWDPFTTLLESV